MATILVTRQIPNRGIDLLKSKGHTVLVLPQDRPVTREELLQALSATKFDAILSILTDKMTDEIRVAAGPQLKIVANYAVGYDNIDVPAFTKAGITVTNTPGVLTDSVAEHTFALMLAIAHRVVESDSFMRAGNYTAWGPMLLLGSDVSGKTLGVVGLGRIGSRVAYHAVKGFNMNVIYYDPKRNENFEKEFGAVYEPNIDNLLKACDFVSIHVPLLPDTQHLINADRLKLMKKSAYLVNTSRGPIIDEKALAEALRSNTIKGAAIDVFEHEPSMEPALKDLSNIIVTPHIASATEETRQKMSEMAAMNILAVLDGKPALNPVLPPSA